MSLIHRRFATIALPVLLATAALPAQAQGQQNQSQNQSAAQQAQARQMQPGTRDQDIVATVLEQGTRLSIFALALEAAGLTEQLRGAGPFTIFAPTDEAFAALPQGTLVRLLRPENRDALRTLLLHHVVQGRELGVEQVINKQQDVETAAGGPLSIDGRGRIVRHVPGGGYKLIQQGDQIVIDQQNVEFEVPQVRVTNAGGRGTVFAIRVVQDDRMTTGSTTGAGQRTSANQGPAAEAGFVVTPQVAATNGVIHAISAVLVPQEIAGVIGAGQGQPRQ